MKCGNHGVIDPSTSFKSWRKIWIVVIRIMQICIAAHPQAQLSKRCILRCPSRINFNPIWSHVRCKNQKESYEKDDTSNPTPPRPPHPQAEAGWPRTSTEGWSFFHFFLIFWNMLDWGHHCPGQITEQCRTCTHSLFGGPHPDHYTTNANLSTVRSEWNEPNQEVR